ncbi:MAG: acyl-CoA dehydrogenase family protein [Candidatus Riflebacteria bacterium]|nr:acyl-CoA dehydrogenase family protein [Candidatus Riflebacteria bacterium]
MDFTYTEEQEAMRAMIRDFVDQEIRPHAQRIDEEEKTDLGIMRKAAELGLLGVQIPEEYGGIGQGKVGFCIFIEELSRGCSGTATAVGGHSSIGSMTILLDGTEEQKRKYLPQLVSGEKLAAFALTEPNAGSDAAAIETTAVKDGDHFILNGRKQWVTNGPFADVVTVFALTDKGLRAHGGVTAFIVEKTFPGFIVGTKDRKMGIRGSESSELIFENCRVPAENVLGRLGAGFLTAMKTLDAGRLSLAAGCLGASKEAIRLSLKHASERIQFGKPLTEQPVIQSYLAEMGADTYAMESMTYRSAWMADAGLRFSRESAICKLFCSEASGRVIDKAVQIMGGLGYMREHPIERMYRDSRINRIFEGTNEIQRLVISRDLIRKGMY